MFRILAAFAIAAVAIVAFFFLAPRPLAAQAPVPEPFYPGRYAIQTTPGGTILLDTSCGATYRLRDVPGRPAAWERLPIDDKGVMTPYPPSSAFNHYANLRSVLETFYTEPEKGPGAARP